MIIIGKLYQVEGADSYRSSRTRSGCFSYSLAWSDGRLGGIVMSQKRTFLPDGEVVLILAEAEDDFYVVLHQETKRLIYKTHLVRLEETP